MTEDDRDIELHHLRKQVSEFIDSNKQFRDMAKAAENQLYFVESREKELRDANLRNEGRVSAFREIIDSLLDRQLTDRHYD